MSLARIDKEVHRFHRLVDRLAHTEAGQRAVAPPPASSSADAEGDAKPADATSDAELVSAFEAAWDEMFGVDTDGYQQGEPKAWYTYRSPNFGETALHWIELMKSINKRGTPLGGLLMQLSKVLLAQKPELLRAAYNDGPFEGQTLLLQACANGDEESVDFFLQYANVADCNAYATGKFITDKLLCEGYPAVQWHTASVLEVAAVAPVDENVAVRLVKKLLANGADAYNCGGQTPVASDDDSDEAPKDSGETVGAALPIGATLPTQRTLLHRLAVSRWRQEPSYDSNRFEMADGEILEASRLRALLDLIFNPPGSKKKKKGVQRQGTLARFLASKDDSLTPLQIASIVGNDIFIIEYLKQKSNVEWQWGHRRAVKMPLFELDCSHMGQTHASVLELLVVYKHRGTLSLNIFVDMISRKWDKFGLHMTIKNLVLQVVYSVLVTNGCFERYGKGTMLGGGVSRSCRRLALAMGVWLTFTRVLMIWMARNTAWNKMMVFDGTARRLGITQVPRIVDIFVFVLGLVVLTLHEVELHMYDDTKHHDILIVLDSLSAIFIFVAWFSLLRFLKLFHNTTVLISVLPVIVGRDMPPWIAVWGVMTIGTAGAIRTSLWHNVADSDEIIGTFWRTAMTLEEATHGPDVQWRYIVMNQPMMAAVFFLIFLWLVTIIMMNLLITIFSATFEARKARAFAELMYWRAVAVISSEKAFPVWFHTYMDYRLGVDLEEIDGMPPTAGSHGEATPLLPRHAKEDKLRYLDINECVGYSEWAKPADNTI